MSTALLHIIPDTIPLSALPDRLQDPYRMPPHPVAQVAAGEVLKGVHSYMRAYPLSELHRRGKMFGVLVVRDGQSIAYLQAFSAMLDGSYHHEGFVPPVYEMTAPPVSHNRAEAQRLQRLLFANYRFMNEAGETRNLLDIFANEKPILSPEEWFASGKKQGLNLPPAGTGECCAPKLLQYAYSHRLQPIALAEFWIGAPPHTELRREGCFYPPCSGKCVPLLRWMAGVLPIPATYSSENSPIPILYEDDFLMVVNKPTGVLSVPGKYGEPSVAEVLQHQTGHTYLQAAHRLDQDTGGLLVLAKREDVYSALQSYFQRRDILKRYEAVLLPMGKQPIAEKGRITLPLLPNPFDRPRQMVDDIHGKPAITDYCIREYRTDGTVFVDFYPRTGRTHQLRVHAAHPEGLNAPISGDRLYGVPSSDAPLSPNRLMLHAVEIRFTHPVTQEEMHFCIPSGF